MNKLSFLIENKWDTFLDKIFKDINTNNYVWKIGKGEILKSADEELFNKEIYVDKDFKKMIKETHYHIFANIQLYKTYDNKNIVDYDSFKESNCVLLLSIIDNCFVDVYCKNDELLKQIEDNAFKNSYKNKKTDNNLTKEKFLIY